MSEEVYFLLDTKNDSILNLQDVKTNSYIYLSSLITLIYWIYIYYNKKLSNISIFTGIFSNIIFISLHYFMNNPLNYLTVNKDNWLLYKSPPDDYVTDFTTIKDEFKIKNLDSKVQGLLVNKKYMDEISKKQTVVQDNEYIKKNKLHENQNITNNKNLRENIFNNIKQLSFQAYTLITILFTILSLTWNTNKKLFDKLLQFFIYSISLTIPVAFSFFWIYDKQFYIDLIDLKEQMFFQVLSMTLAILTEVIYLNSK